MHTCGIHIHIHTPHHTHTCIYTYMGYMYQFLRAFKDTHTYEEEDTCNYRHTHTPLKSIYRHTHT
jgi:hypothetical protein